MSQSTINLTTEVTGPVECLGLTFSSDEARREHYLRLLAEKLKDPDFRKIEGFPIGKDEDILALSDPPYYTACPNPWLHDFVKHYGKPYDPKQPYHREPFAADVSEGKNHPIYNAHSYHTKVPHRAIMRYLLHYTEPGDVVFDGFCGTGMTGVAAQLCGDRAEVQELGYHVQDAGTILNAEGRPCSRLGARKTILNDLSPAATFIAFNYNSSADADTFEAVSMGAWQDVEREWGWMFTTLCGAPKSVVEMAAAALRTCRTCAECKALLASKTSLLRRIGNADAAFDLARVNYVVWSDVFTCSECGSTFLFWDVATDPSDWSIREVFKCAECDALLSKTGIKRKRIKSFDPVLHQAVVQAEQRPALIHVLDKRYPNGKPADAFDNALLEVIESKIEPDGRVPSDPLPDGFNTSQPRTSHGFTHVHHFYTKRNLIVLAAFARLLGPGREYVNITSSGVVLSKLYRFRSQGGCLGAGGGPMNGTLYVPSLVKEIPALKVLKEHIAKSAQFRRRSEAWERRAVISTGDASHTEIESESVDYVFVDPPFGGNINYSELNFMWESWLQVFTNNTPEAITNEVQGKKLLDYAGLMRKCFQECFRILKPGRWITIEFSNTRASVWNVIQTALQEAGFVVANVSALDKQQGSFKAVTTTTAVKQDLVISAYKPNGGLEERFAKRGETEEGVWDFIMSHLKNLPIAKPRGGQLEVIAERDPRILYDRMVAFYVGHSTPVPLSSAEFQAGLAERLPERDGMYFLPEQVNEYDKKRAQMEDIGQLTIFVEDERSAINWLRSFLKDRPSTYQDIQPEFMQQLGASWRKWEARPELSTLLDQNFLCYDGVGEVPGQIHGYLSSQFRELRNLPKDHPQLKAKAKSRWYVPDPKRNVDVETLRHKRLLEEFWSYLPDGYTPPALTARKGETLPGLVVPPPKTPKGKKLKELRTEAVRVGFKHCYQQKDYTTILVVAQMLPESVLNEDEQLQMIYDTAVTRTGTQD